MHIVNGKSARAIDAAAVAGWAARYPNVTLDLGTGDGRFVRDMATKRPDEAVIGVDTCQANLRVSSRTAPGNALFVVADALALPGEVHRLATRVTINFPWGSLLRGLLDGQDGLTAGLRAVDRVGTSLEVKLNAGALAEAGWTLEEGGKRIAEMLHQIGFVVAPVRIIGSDQLRAYPTTWAKRLAFGRDPRAIQVSAVLPENRTGGMIHRVWSRGALKADG